MTQKQIPKPTNSELEILQILWHMGPSTVRVIHDQLAKHRDIGYTTTLKIMQIMHDKNILTRTKEGKTHIYRPAAPMEKTQKQLLDRFVETAFQGSTSNLIMQVLGNKKTTSKELKEIKDFIQKLEGGQNE